MAKGIFNSVPSLNRFFITSSVLDVTIVGLDYVDGDASSQGQRPHFLKTCSKLNLDLGNAVYLLEYMGKKDLKIGEGKVVIATDNLIKLSADGEAWSPGSAGFYMQGNLAREAKKNVFGSTQVIAREAKKLYSTEKNVFTGCYFSPRK